MANSLSDLTDNFAEGINKIKCKYEHDNKKYGTCGNLEYVNVKDDIIGQYTNDLVAKIIT